MIGTWNPDVSLRPKAQSVMRDVNQILYEGAKNLKNNLYVVLTYLHCLVYNSRRSNVYEMVNDQRSLNGSMASGLTEATSTYSKFSLMLLNILTYCFFLHVALRALSENHDTISFDSQFDDHTFQVFRLPRRIVKLIIYPHNLL